MLTIRDSDDQHPRLSGPRPSQRLPSAVACRRLTTAICACAHLPQISSKPSMFGVETLRGEHIAPKGQGSSTHSAERDPQIL